jgi:hypothetical protein
MLLFMRRPWKGRHKVLFGNSGTFRTPCGVHGAWSLSEPRGRLCDGFGDLGVRWSD